jgi:hypothetical protein
LLGGRDSDAGLKFPDVTPTDMPPLSFGVSYFGGDGRTCATLGNDPGIAPRPIEVSFNFDITTVSVVIVAPILPTEILIRTRIEFRA